MIFSNDKIFSNWKFRLGLLACIAISIGCVQSETLENLSGATICIQPIDAQAEEEPIVAGEPLRVRVTACVQDDWEFTDASCEAEVSGQEIIISSKFNYDVPYSFGDTITRPVCHDHTTTCELSALSEGEYTVIHGEKERELVVPSDAQQVHNCF